MRASGSGVWHANDDVCVLDAVICFDRVSEACAAKFTFGQIDPGGREMTGKLIITNK